ncbi:MAG: glycosyltransferase family 2 protein [Anaerorhabdus sp.]|uniref:glycosyltransferase family 2 protein n=1 Tax=Anaerorhabdus sp. TaxID=1872524 RepID=UPI002FC81264
MDSLVSVIIPAYNSENTIKRCIQSVINQSYKNLEVIVLNDCSSDKTIEVVKTIDDSRIKLINLEKNMGVSYCRNKGKKLAKGEYIQFIDSDDYVELEMLKEVITFIEDNDLDVCIFGMNVIYEKYKREYSINCKEQLKSSVGNKTEAFRILLNSGLLNATWNKIYKRKIIENIEYPEFTSGEDLQFNLETFLITDNFGIINKAYYNYIQYNPQSLSHCFIANNEDRCNILEKYYADLFKKYDLKTEDDLNFLKKMRDIDKLGFISNMYRKGSDFSFHAKKLLVLRLQSDEFKNITRNDGLNYTLMKILKFKIFACFKVAIFTCLFFFGKRLRNFLFFLKSKFSK